MARTQSRRTSPGSRVGDARSRSAIGALELPKELGGTRRVDRFVCGPVGANRVDTAVDKVANALLDVVTYRPDDLERLNGGGRPRPSPRPWSARMDTRRRSSESPPSPRATAFRASACAVGDPKRRCRLLSWLGSRLARFWAPVSSGRLRADIRGRERVEEGLRHLGAPGVVGADEQHVFHGRLLEVASVAATRSHD